MSQTVISNIYIYFFSLAYFFPLKSIIIINSSSYRFLLIYNMTLWTSIYVSTYTYQLTYCLQIPLTCNRPFLLQASHNSSRDLLYSFTNYSLSLIQLLACSVSLTSLLSIYLSHSHTPAHSQCIDKLLKDFYSLLITI